MFCFAFCFLVQHQEERGTTRTGTRGARQPIDAQEENTRRACEGGRNGRGGRIYE